MLAAAHLQGGSEAGYARWAAFKTHELNQYSSMRNNFMHRNGVSRLSPYHHWGMISPWRIAREAANLRAHRHSLRLCLGC
jgi:deoxyribodipyrimidine photolyase